ncbi:MAG TPA: HDOD domain-containing protein [Bryobacteraceae bacterium]|nr:HDOD domain-containing protein [Bryobacteraceae bacterium]
MSMDVYIGRQPILDRAWNIAAYELLFRSGKNESCEGTDDVSATPQVISNAATVFGLDRLLGDKPAFIRFDRTRLIGDWTTCLAPDKVVIEIVGTNPADQETLTACERLNELGYALALNDCLDDGRTEAFAPFVDILKVDFQQTSATDQESLIRRYKNLKLRMVACKVETEFEFVRASQLGYHYFQGFFFASPTVLQTPKVPASQMGGLRLMKEVQKEELDLNTLEPLIRHDLAFSHSLLTYLNSANFNWKTRIESVRQGLIMLGTDQIRKWVWMATVSSLGQNRPPILMGQVLMRGRFCEEIASAGKLNMGDADPFLAGMFSLLDAILRRPLKDILDELNIGGVIRSALLGATDESDSLSRVLAIVKAYERSDFQAVDAGARAIHLSADVLNACYLRSLSWVESIHSNEEKTWRASHAAPLPGFHREAESRSRPFSA